jgi:uncharacterized phage protein (TIGR01671 family)
MNREIKFRAWLKELETLIPSEQVLGFVSQPINSEMKHDTILKYSSLPLKGGYTVDEENSEHYILMQYIGLKDKTGKEIYEGDILSFLEGRYKCVWATQGCMFTMQMISKVEVTKFLNPDNYDRAEIIGNIYKNPELIK